MEDKIKNIMINIFNLDLDDTGEELSVETIENWDSINHMNLVLALEEEFKVNFDDDEVPELLSFDAIKLVLERLC